MSTEAEKTAAEARIEELLQQSRKVVKEAMTIADAHGLTFSYEPDHLGDYYGKGNTEYRGEDDPLPEGQWSPSAWSSSSIYC